MDNLPRENDFCHDTHRATIAIHSCFLSLSLSCCHVILTVNCSRSHSLPSEQPKLKLSTPWKFQHATLDIITPYENDCKGSLHSIKLHSMSFHFNTNDSIPHFSVLFEFCFVVIRRLMQVSLIFNLNRRASEKITLDFVHFRWVQVSK